MAFSIDDSAFPPTPEVLPEYNDLLDKAFYRLPDGDDYYRRVNGDASYGFTENAIVGIPDPHMKVQPVTAELVITAP